jgi:hypothetical protein
VQLVLDTKMVSPVVWERLRLSDEAREMMARVDGACHTTQLGPESAARKPMPAAELRNQAKERGATMVRLSPISYSAGVA